MPVDGSFRLRDLDLGGAGGIEVERFESVHWDSQDWRLAAWEAGLRFRRGRGWRVTLATELQGDVIVRRELDLPGRANQPPPEALRLLAGYLRGAPVTEVARLRHLHSRRMVSDGLSVGHEVISRMVHRRATGGTRRVTLRAQGELGNTKPLLKVLGRAGLSPTTEPALAAASGEAARAAWREIPLAGDAPVAVVVAAALRDFTARLIRNLPLVIEGSDPEGVHQARVACRRLRSALQTFGPVLDVEWARGLRDALKSVAASLGTVRDADVMLVRLRHSAAAFPGTNQEALDHLLDSLVRQRVEARERLLAEFESPEHFALLERLLLAAVSPAILPEVAAQPAVEALGGMVRSSWRRLRRRVQRLGDSPADDDLHGIRINAKRCRYAVLALVPVLGAAPARTAAALGDLQDVLGDFHDAIVAAGWLREHADEASGFVAGALYAAELARADEGRRAWGKTWAVVARKRMWRWL